MGHPIQRTPVVHQAKVHQALQTRGRIGHLQGLSHSEERRAGNGHSLAEQRCSPQLGPLRGRERPAVHLEGHPLEELLGGVSFGGNRSRCFPLLHRRHRLVRRLQLACQEWPTENLLQAWIAAGHFLSPGHHGFQLGLACSGGLARQALRGTPLFRPPLSVDGEELHHRQRVGKILPPTIRQGESVAAGDQQP